MCGTETNTFEIEVLAHRAASAEIKIKKVQKRAKRLGQVFEYTRSGQYIVERDYLQTINYVDCTRDENNRKVYKIEVVKFIITGTAPKVDGWEFLAKIEHQKVDSSYMNIITKSPYAKEVATTEYRTCKPDCDHCHKNRARKITYIVHNEEKNETLQVGKSCLRDFTGIDKPENILSCFEYDKLVRELSDSFNMDFYIDLEKLVAYTYAIMDSETKGRFVSKKQAQINESLTPTSTLVTLMFTYENNQDVINFKRDIVKLVDENPEYIAKAKGAIDWIRANQDDVSEYIWNLKAIFSVDILMNIWQVGLAASLVIAHDSSLKKDIVRVNLNKSNFVGNKGDKQKDVEVTYIGCKDFGYNRYNGECVHLYEFLDNQGNILAWKTDIYLPGRIELAKGNKYLMSGTVSKHNTFNDIKSTWMNRCKFKEL